VLTCRKPTKIPQNPKTLGEHIKKRRLELGLFQAQMAGIIGVDESTVTNWEKENTKPMLWAIPRIIEFLGYEPTLRSNLTLGEEIRVYRYKRGIPQKELARQLGVDPTTLGRWERDECQPNESIMRRLGSLFHTLDRY
jgi:DNA-binding XRE family transcriptional regulator